MCECVWQWECPKISFVLVECGENAQPKINVPSKWNEIKHREGTAAKRKFGKTNEKPWQNKQEKS